MSSCIQIFSMNVRGLQSVKKRADVFNWAKSKNPSILCFQETHSTEADEKKWEDEIGFKCYFSHGDSKSAGVCVMFKPGLLYEVHDSIIDKNGRYVILDVTIFEHRLTLVSLYGYNLDRPELFAEILFNVLKFKNTSYTSVETGM